MCNHDDDHDDEQPQPDTSPWIICPTCAGEGKHSRDLGSFTQTEFNEAFDDAESREAYFGGRYDKGCSTCGGSGKIRESQLHKHEEQLERERIAETGRNSAGEPVCFPSWYRG